MNMKKLMALTFALVLALTIAAFGNDNSGAVKTKREVEAALTNYSISLVFDAQGQKTYNFRQASSDKGTFFEAKNGSHEITYFDFTRRIGYELDADEKCGESIPLRSVERYKGFQPYVANHLFMHESYKSNMTKTGSEKILGRDTTVYTVTFHNAELKLWIDNEYGFTLKYVQTGSNAMTMRVTGFTVGGVNVEGMVNLAEYEID
jgi:outer membrane lipoprotein-sorting protein